MATSKPADLKPLNILCDHNGNLEYWCMECAYEAAAKLRVENERLTAECARLAEKRRIRGRR